MQLWHLYGEFVVFLCFFCVLAHTDSITIPSLRKKTDKTESALR